MDRFRFAHQLRVRWVEVDAQRIVFNAHYLTYADIAFAEYLRRGLGVSEGDMLHTMIAKTTLTFLQSARYDELLTIWVRVAHLGNTSLQVEFTVARDDEVLAQIETVYVHVDEASGRPAPVPAVWRSEIRTYEPALNGLN